MVCGGFDDAPTKRYGHNINVNKHDVGLNCVNEISGLQTIDNTSHDINNKNHSKQNKRH